MANGAPSRTGNGALFFRLGQFLIGRATYREIELTLPLPEDALPTNLGIDPQGQYQYRLDAQPTNALDKPAIRPTSPKLIPASYAEPPP